MAEFGVSLSKHRQGLATAEHKSERPRTSH